MKTIRELLMELPEDVRQLAIDCAYNHVIDTQEPSDSNTKMALKRAFIWKYTKHGHEFWENIYNSLPC